MTAKLNVKGYDTDLTVIDLVTLKPDKTFLSISTTVYILLVLKTYKEERKFTELPAPTMPADNIRGAWNLVNNLVRPVRDPAVDAAPKKNLDCRLYVLIAK